MDRFLVSNANKRPCSDGDTPSSPTSKKPRPCAKQRNVSAAIRVAEFGRSLFYADGGKLFCRPCNAVVDHHRKHTISKHLDSKVILKPIFNR
ncbi:MAG: hypothetical protein GY820_37295 [Gammaproteobacteria bacterium]|nr:hypothetical protein [Gammaproteobacteria bacterium]